MKPWQRPSLAVLPVFAFCVLLTFSSLRTKFATWIALPMADDSNFDSTLMQQAAVDIGAAIVKRDAVQLVQSNFSSGPVKYRPTALQLLHDWLDKNYFEPSVILQLVNQIKTPIDRHNGNTNSDKLYSSCAVVGNSGILLNSNNGKLIDGHEFVIRINNAPTDPYAQHVGSKTSLSFINSNVLDHCTVYDECFCRSYGGHVPTAMYICQPKHFADYAICKNSSITPLIVTDPRFDMLCARLVKYYSLKQFVEETGMNAEKWGDFHDREMFHYSSGMQAVMLAMGICRQVSLFGFGKQEGAHHHYHTRQRSELGLHDYAAEYALYDDLVMQPEAVPFVNAIPGFRLPKVVVYH
jgi:beta-1,6-galactosyltransferase